VIRILHVLTSPRAEGTPRLVLDWLATGIGEQGVLILTPEPAELTAQFQRASAWVRFGLPFRRAPAKYWQIAALTRDSVREFRPDLVVAWPAGWSHWIHLGSFLGGQSRRLTHAGTAPGVGIYHRYVHTWLCFGLARLCGHHVVACSRYVQSAYTAIPFLSAEHIRFVHNCCNVARFLRPSEAPPRVSSRVCMVGSLEKSKDYGNLLRAWKVVEAAGPYELWIAGGGSKRAEFETLAGQLGLKRVRFLGAIEDVPSLLWSSTVFAFSANIEEGFGTVLIEALAAGCAVVATDVPACREVLEGGKYGRLVAAKDPGALGAAVIAALQCPLPAVESAQGVAYAQGFTAERMIESYLGIARGGNAVLAGPIPAR